MGLCFFYCLLVGNTIAAKSPVMATKTPHCNQTNLQVITACNFLLFANRTSLKARFVQARPWYENRRNPHQERLFAMPTGPMTTYIFLDAMSICVKFFSYSPLSLSPQSCMTHNSISSSCPEAHSTSSHQRTFYHILQKTIAKNQSR